MPSKSVRDWSPLVQLVLSLQMERVHLVLLVALNAPVLLSAPFVEVMDSTPQEDCALVNAVTESKQETKDAMMATVSTETVAQPHAQSKPTGYVLVTDQLPADPMEQLFVEMVESELVNSAMTATELQVMAALTAESTTDGLVMLVDADPLWCHPTQLTSPTWNWSAMSGSTSTTSSASSELPRATPA